MQVKSSIEIEAETAGQSERSGRAPAREVALALLEYCEARDWAGHDPYDALNSPVWRRIPFLNFKLARLALTQVNKRSPVNLRPLLGIGPKHNPKGLALFVSSLLSLSRSGVAEKRLAARDLCERLLESRSPDHDLHCWGYSFPWQTRWGLVPAGAPNLVCTTFAANALLDAYEETGESRFAESARSAAEYLVDELYYSSAGGSVAGFAYPLPSMRHEIHNANFLAAALLARAGAVCGDGRFLEPALAGARYSAAKQHRDGSWAYGERRNYRWVDHFHTGFNLCALRELGNHARTDEFEPVMARGFDYYRRHFFRDDGAPKYYDNRTYPIDAHCVAQAIITLVELRDLRPGSERLARKVMDWAHSGLWDSRGYFHYRVYAVGKNRISYMRWTQAWMLRALATLLEMPGRTGPGPSGAGGHAEERRPACRTGDRSEIASSSRSEGA